MSTTSSTQSDDDRRAQNALINLRLALRDLAANIMRVARGAGASVRLGDQMMECIRAMIAYHDITEHGVASWDLDQMLNIEPLFLGDRHLRFDLDDPDFIRWQQDGTFDCELADLEVYRAALRVVAAALVDQPLQRRNGELDVTRAIRMREDAQEHRRAHHRSRRESVVSPRRKSKRPVRQ